MRVLDRLERSLTVQPGTSVLDTRRVLPHGSKVCPVIVGNDFVRDNTSTFDRLFEERLDTFYVTISTQ